MSEPTNLQIDKFVDPPACAFRFLINFESLYQIKDTSTRLRTKTARQQRFLPEMLRISLQAGA